VRIPFILLESDRSALLACLSIPFAAALLAFIIAVGLTAFGVPIVGTARSSVAGFAFVYLILCFIWLPAYGAACAWYWWATRGDDSRLLMQLYALPLIAAVFAWFPGLAFIDAPLLQRARIYATFAIPAIIVGYVWVGIVRLMFFSIRWRKRS
jgi:hypothetical protein